MAYHSKAHELFYGGAAGGGKTSLAVGLALTQHHRSLLLRRQAVQSVEIVEQLRRFAGRTGSWRSLGYGGTMNTETGKAIEIGGCDHEDEKEKYAGRPHDLIVFDEASHFSRSQVQFISAWNRHENVNQRCRIVLPGNPPTSPEGRWIIEEFAPWLDMDYGNMARAGELRWYSMLKGELIWVDGPEPFFDGGERIIPRSRTFIPGRLADNPILAATDYGSRLQALPEPLRSQLLYGDFAAGTEEDPWQIIPTAWIRAAMARWKENPPNGQTQSSLGVDVARGGKDKTVIAARYGSWFARLRKYPGSKTPDGQSVVDLVIPVLEGHGPVNVDVIGVGSSVYDLLKSYIWFKTVPVSNSERCDLTDRSGKLGFVNVRAASYWKFREALDPVSSVKIALPPDNELLADLCAPRYKVMASGIQVESKEDIIKRLGRSPDAADAVILAYWKSDVKEMVFRAYSFRTDAKKKNTSFVLASKEALSVLTVEERSLLIVLDNPDTDSESLPPHALTALQGSVTLRFADINPPEVQDRWTEVFLPYDKTPESLIFSRDQARKLWALILKPRDPPVRVIVICDNGEGDRRAESVVKALTDVMGIPRKEICYAEDLYTENKVKESPPSNPYIFDMVKAMRGAMMG